MSKREYLALLLTMPSDWLIRSANSPSVDMTHKDVLLHKLAIRKLMGRGFTC